MKLKRIVFGFLLLSLLACNFVTQMVFPPTATPAATLTVTSPPTMTATPLVPAYIPPECGSTPLATVPPDFSTQATPEFQVTAIPQGEQLSILRELGHIVEKVYVYPD